jgi:hypothetical protein
MFLASVEVKIYREKSGTSETEEGSRFDVRGFRNTKLRTQNSELRVAPISLT